MLDVMGVRILYFVGVILLKFKGRKPSVIIMLDGGFGSTIWKYCMGKIIEKNGNNVKYDLTWYSENGMDMNGKNTRKFELTTVFPHLKFEIANTDEVELYKKYFYYRNNTPYVFNDYVVNCKSPSYIDGYYEHWRYLDMVGDDVYRLFDFNSIIIDGKNKAIDYQISLHEASVCVHVRRGDYVGTGLDVLGKEYFISAMSYIQNRLDSVKPKFFIFSNEMSWVKENLCPFLEVRGLEFFLVEENSNENGFYDFYLISKGKHQVSSNSSFGFLGSILNKNPNKIVVIPDRWLHSSVSNDPATEGSELAHRIPGYAILGTEGKVYHG